MAADGAPAAGNLPPPRSDDAPADAESNEAAAEDVPAEEASLAAPAPAAAPMAAPPPAPSTFAPPTGLGDPVAFFPLNEGVGTEVGSYPGGALSGKFNTSTVR